MRLVSKLLWHSEADKIVNNFHAQNFMVKHTFLWSKLIFLCSDLANFLGQSPVHPDDKISCSKRNDNQARSQDFLKGGYIGFSMHGVYEYACMQDYRGVWGHAPPGNFFRN